MAWAIDDVAPVMGRGELHGLPDLGRRSVASWSGSSARSSASDGGGPTCSASVVAALVVPWLVGANLRSDGSIGGPFEATAIAAVQAVLRPRRRDELVHQPVRPPPVGHRPARLGDLDVRGLRHVRPSPAAQRGRAHRGGPRHQHGPDGQRPAWATWCCTASPRCSCSSASTPSTSRPSGSAGGSAIRPRSPASTCAAAPSSSPWRSSGSLLLTTAASSDPLAGAWDGVSDRVVRSRGRSPSTFPVGPNSPRPSVHEFGDEHADPRVLGQRRPDPASRSSSSPDEDDRVLLAGVDLRHVRPQRLDRRRRRPRPRSRPATSLLDGTLENVADASWRPAR